ncbi:hypothetical protein [Ferruginibacter sp.]
MAETHIVFNDQLELYGQQYITQVAPIPIGENASPEYQKKKILALLFEQFLLFDKIAIKIDRENLELYFLIKELGINKVEELIEYGIIIPVLWTPIIVTSLGMKLPDGSMDESSIIGQPPLISGKFSDEDSDPERNLDKLLSYFSFHKDRKRIFKKRVIDKYVLPDNSIADNATKIVIDAYVKGQLTELGLNNDKEPENLNLVERDKLFQLGHSVLETTVLAEKNFKSYDKYQNYSLTKGSVRNIETAYHVSENTSEILKIENLANIQDYVIENKIPFERVFDLRYKKNIKEYRKWINTLSKSIDTKNITEEYIDEIAGKNKFFESTGGKFVRTVAMFGLGSGVGGLIAGPTGAAAGGIIGKAAELGLSMLDTYVLDGILKGWNPRMFVDDIKNEVADEQKLNP